MAQFETPFSWRLRIPAAILGGMKDKSHKGQKHKGCWWCNPYKQMGNGDERRPARDRRQLERATQEIATTR